jgi:hypothetical protein
MVEQFVVRSDGGDSWQTGCGEGMQFERQDLRTRNEVQIALLFDAVRRGLEAANVGQTTD